jgi:hypothetical protein
VSLLPSSAEINIVWSYTSIPLYVFMEPWLTGIPDCTLPEEYNRRRIRHTRNTDIPVLDTKYATHREKFISVSFAQSKTQRRCRYSERYNETKQAMAAACRHGGVVA